MSHLIHRLTGMNVTQNDTLEIAVAALVAAGFEFDEICRGRSQVCSHLETATAA